MIIFSKYLFTPRHDQDRYDSEKMQKVIVAIQYKYNQVKLYEIATLVLKVVDSQRDSLEQFNEGLHSAVDTTSGRLMIMYGSICIKGSLEIKILSPFT